MTRRRLLLFALAAVVVLAAGVWLLWPQPAITPENAAKIKQGMTLMEVEAILGAPAGDYRTDQQVPGPVPAFGGHETVISWHADATSVGLTLDEHGHVMSLSYTMHAPEPIFGKIRRWLHL